MPSINPMAEVFQLDAGGGGSVGPVSGRVSGNIGVDEHHVSAAVVLIGLGLLVLLWQSKFRFSMTVGGG